MKHTNALCIVLAAMLQPLGMVAQPAMGHNVTQNRAVDDAVKTKISQWMQNNGGLSFLENKGQMLDMEGNSVKSLLFRASGGGVDMYVTTSGLSYVFVQKEVTKQAKVNSLGEARDSIIEHYCRADMELAGADIRDENIVKEYESPGYNNYYLGKVCPGGILNVHSYERVTVKNIYPGIDWVLYTADGAEGEVSRAGLQYDFVVHPGADPSLIKLKYRWTDKPEMQNDGSLKINIPLGYIEEGTPVSYAVGGGDLSDELKNKQAGTVSTTYSVYNNEIGFALAGYNKDKTLIIDPPLSWGMIWSTYFGGNGTDIGECIRSDGTHAWLTGTTSSTSFPTLNEGGTSYFQSTLAGAADNIFVAEFTTTGAQVWTTYYGGTSSGESDNGEGISFDANNIWIAAQVTSAADFPTYCNPIPTAVTTTTYNYYQDYDSIYNFSGLNGSPAAGYTAGHPVDPCSAVLEFNKATGARLFASYFSGICEEGDYARSIWDDGTYVWMAGTASSTCFPDLYSTGYYNNTYVNNTAPFLVQFTTAGGVLWSTYFGNGSIGDATCISVCSDGKNVWLAGDAYPGGLPTQAPSAAGGFYQGADPDADGNATAFIAEFTIDSLTTGHPQWCTYLGGSNPTNIQTFGGDWDRTGYAASIYSNDTDVWVTGLTGSNNFPITNPGGSVYYQSVYGGDFDAFVTKFSVSGIEEWATYYGGSGTDVGNSIQKDDAGNVWVTGSTTSTNFPVTPYGCAYNQDALAGAQNAFILQFDTSGERYWASYWGGNGSDVGNSIYGDGNNIWLTGSTSSSNLATETPTPVVYFAGAYNQSTLEGAQNAFIAHFIPEKPFSATLGTPTNPLCYGDKTGSAAITTVSGGTTPYTYSWSPSGGSNASASGLSGGTYTVVVTDFTGCIEEFPIIITQPDAISITTSVTVTCSSTTSSATANATGGTGPYIYTWSPSGGTNTTASGLAAGTYTITVSDINGCSGSQTAVVSQRGPLGITAGTPQGITCNGLNDGSASISVSGGSGTYTYLWTPSAETGSTASGLSAGAYEVIITDANGCTDSTTVIVTQPALLTVSVKGKSVCAGRADTLASTVDGGTQPYMYSWSSSGGKGATDIITPTVSGTYTTTVTDANGCTATATVSLHVNPSPNPVFSPTIDSVNGGSTVNFINQTTGNNTYYWNFGDGTNSTDSSPSHQYNVAGIFPVELIVTNSYGCVDSAVGEIIVKEIIKVPNVFTPNGDNVNDYFVVTAAGMKTFDIQIYDRWGKKVFESTSVTNSWNGKSPSGQEESDGVYYYILQTTDYLGNNYNREGYLQLIR